MKYSILAIIILTVIVTALCMLCVIMCYINQLTLATYCTASALVLALVILAIIKSNERTK